jgi:quinol monooxygenase YgiN
MLAMWVRVRVKPEGRERFLKAIEVDAEGSERDEPGCSRFNVLQDEQDQNVYYFFEVYRDEAALEAHRAAPHYGRLARGRGHAGRRAPGDALPDRLPRGGGVLGAKIAHIPGQTRRPRRSD